MVIFHSYVSLPEGINMYQLIGSYGYTEMNQNLLFPWNEPPRIQQKHVYIYIYILQVYGMVREDITIINCGT